MTTEQLQPSTAATATTRPRSVYRGSLALFRTVEAFERYPYNVEHMKAAKALLRSKKRQRPSMEDQPLTRLIKENPPEQSICSNNVEFVLLFFFHPRQPHSLRLRSILADFCQQNQSKVVCLGVYGGNLQMSSQADQDDARLFLTGTGLQQIPIGKLDDNHEGPEQEEQNQNQSQTQTNVASDLINFLNVTHIPSVVVIPTTTGRPIMGQEAAIKWNVLAALEQQEGEEGSPIVVEGEADTDALFARWHAGSSGLTYSQSLLATVLGDSSSVCNVM